jgi:hypothetical protein
VGDYITSVNNCVVKNVDDWKSCLRQAIVEQQHGFCTDMMTMTRKNTFLGKALLTCDICTCNKDYVK